MSKRTHKSLLKDMFGNVIVSDTGRIPGGLESEGDRK